MNISNKSHEESMLILEAKQKLLAETSKTTISDKELIVTILKKYIGDFK